MSFVSGIAVIDAPASALNNGQGEDTKSKVKSIYVRGQGDYPYVAAQSYRYWLRETLARQFPQWLSSPVYTAGQGKKQQAFTEGDPIRYWDDDLLGYMRAEKSETVTRISPFRTSTMVSLSPVQLVDDFGVMARVKKDKDDKEGVLLHGHEFYRATMLQVFSFDLRRAGTFTDVKRAGYQNLGEATRKLAADKGLDYLEAEEAFRLPLAERVERIQTLLRAIGRIEGGANQTLHYTDVTPVFLMAAVTSGGNNLFGRLLHTGTDGHPYVHEKALAQTLRVFGGDLLSDIFVGRVEGFMDSATEVLGGHADIPGGKRILSSETNGQTLHPREAIDRLTASIGEDDNTRWLE